MQQPRTITRCDLYALVWSKPISALAIEFGISNRGLAKVCGRHRIPVPPRGYCAKVAAGERPKVPPFLEWKDRSLDQVIVRGAISSLPDSIAELAMKRKAERQGRGTSENEASDVPLSMATIPHPTVAKTAKALRTKKWDSDGVVSATGLGHCGVIVSPTCTERAVVILDGLARGLEWSGLTLIPEGGKMSLKRGTDAVNFTLLERTKRVAFLKDRALAHSELTTALAALPQSVAFNTFWVFLSGFAANAFQLVSAIHNAAIWADCAAGPDDAFDVCESGCFIVHVRGAKNGHFEKL